jgi:hypothetical protein
VTGGCEYLIFFTLPLITFVPVMLDVILIIVFVLLINAVKMN